MGDTFLEYIIKRKPEPKTSLLKVAIILVTVVICYFGLILLTSSQALMQFGSIFLLLLAGKRESGGKIKYAVTDRLPNELHLLFHLVLLLSLLSLVGNSVYTVLHPHVDFGLTAATDYYVLRAELCTVSIYLTLTGMLCTFKRHYANRYEHSHRY